MIRCAIYTRKSSDEGLEQDFNSLDAQREACAAYILSQASEGWIEVTERYDDGGISGGTLERPGLKRLLADVAAGRIDIIVVYKVDRLTRSLLDFSKLVETLDGAGTSFVSVTQSFNTTTSMGRLTLNMLLSFAQFEREVTAERIRDKIAASKAKGMWMGGIPPLGYRPDGRSLAIVPEQAALVTAIFRRYLALGSVRLLTEALEKEGILAPERSTATGKRMGGRPFTRGQLYLLLSCRTYLGEISHHGKIHPGLHEAIVDRDLWNEVQAMLADNRQGHRSGRRACTPSLLAGLVTDSDGKPLIADHATKGKVRYRYYASRQTGHARNGEGLRIPARELETAVVERLAQAFGDPLLLASELALPMHMHPAGQVAEAASVIVARLRGRSRETVLELVEAVEVARDRISIRFSVSSFAAALGLEACEPPSLILSSHVRLTRSGRALRLVHEGGARPATEADPALVRLIVRANHWWRILRSEQIDVKTLSRRERVSASWMTRVLRIAFLSPVVTEALLTGRQRGELDSSSLLATGAVDPGWKVQEAVLLPSAAGNGPATRFGGCSGER